MRIPAKMRNRTSSQLMPRIGTELGMGTRRS
jgi:hypothetical protein